jgi:hypothetical protein
LYLESPNLKYIFDKLDEENEQDINDAEQYNLINDLFYNKSEMFYNTFMNLLNITDKQFEQNVKYMINIYNENNESKNQQILDENQQKLDENQKKFDKYIRENKNLNILKCVCEHIKLNNFNLDNLFNHVSTNQHEGINDLTYLINEYINALDNLLIEIVKCKVL